MQTCNLFFNICMNHRFLLISVKKPSPQEQRQNLKPI